jgi:hypothetical protein
MYSQLLLILKKYGEIQNDTEKKIENVQHKKQKRLILDLPPPATMSHEPLLLDPLD